MTGGERDADRPVRIALLGTAHVHLGDHLAVLAADPKAELAAVHDGGSGYRVRVPGAGHAPSAREALRGADAALVLSTTAEHAGLVSAVLAAGIPALVEKPLAAGYRESAELADRIAAAGVPVHTAMFLRCAPALRRVRELLEQGALGALTAVHARFAHPGLEDGAFSGAAAWMLERRHGGGGAFADLGVHLVDLLLWLRPGEPLAVRGAHLVRRPGVQGDAGGAALLAWGRVPAVLHAGWTSRPGGFGLDVEGERATVRVRGGRLRLETGAEVLTEEHAAPSAGDAAAAFLAGLRGRRGWSPPEPAEAVEAARVLEAASRAAEAG